MTQPDRSAEEKADVFRALHHAPDILVLPNAWDVTSAMLLEQADFAAIATTSAGIGYTFGYPIGQKMPRRDMLGVLERITARIACPLTADMEAGYGDTPEEVAETVRLTWAAGAVGINLEDRTYEADAPLIEVSPAAARIEAAPTCSPIRSAGRTCFAAPAPIAFSCRASRMRRPSGGWPPRSTRR